MKYGFDFYTSHNQFYICDSESSKNSGSKDFWNDESYNDRISVETGFIGVRTESFGHIKGEFELLDKENKIDNYNLYDHIVEAGIEIKSNTLKILDCPNSSVEKEIKIIPGMYKVRIYSMNLIGVDMDEDEGDDLYKIEIWESIDLKKKVLKRYIPV